MMQKWLVQADIETTAIHAIVVDPDERALARRMHMAAHSSLWQRKLPIRYLNLLR
jgi:hypothetical protein